MKDDVLPRVIVADRVLALMNALEVVFPSATNLLCEFHISKNVRTKCKILMTKAKDWEVVLEAWASLVNSTNEQIYEQRLKIFTHICPRYPTFQKYVYYTWLLHH